MAVGLMNATKPNGGLDSFLKAPVISGLAAVNAK
jgi:hypothetical protein